MKREPVNDEREQDGWLANTLRQSPPSGESCLDTETLAAWADGGLPAQAAAAVELHASTCARCTAVLAAMARTSPAAPVRHAWAPAHLFRWLVPLTAALTAVALWIAVPDRQVTPVPAAPARDLQLPRERTDASAKPDPGAQSADSRGQVPVPVPVPEGRNRAVAPSTAKTEPQATYQLRDEVRREAAKPETFGARAAAEAQPAAPAAEAPPAALAEAPARAQPPPPVPAPVAQPPVSTDTLAGTAATAKRSTFNSTAISSEFITPSNPLVRWRVAAGVSVERSTDGGKTWTRRTPPPGVAPNSTPAITMFILRAVDADRAVVRTSNGEDFYTANGGMSWTRAQENSPAPF